MYMNSFLLGINSVIFIYAIISQVRLCMGNSWLPGTRVLTWLSSSVLALVLGSIAWFFPDPSQGFRDLGYIVYVTSFSLSSVFFIFHVLQVTFPELFRHSLVLRIIALLIIVLSLGLPIFTHLAKYSPTCVLLGNTVFPILLGIASISASIVSIQSRTRLALRELVLFSSTAGFISLLWILPVIFSSFAIIRPGLAGFVLVSFLLLRHQAWLIDSLTGVANRTALEIRLPVIIRTMQAHSFLYAIMLSVHRKGVYNKMAAARHHRRMLRAFAAILLRVFRTTDFVVRSGDDEFCIFFELHDPSELSIVQERLKCASEQWNRNADPLLELNYIIAIDSYQPGESAKSFMSRLNILLHKSKQKCNCNASLSDSIPSMSERRKGS